MQGGLRGGTDCGGGGVNFLRDVAGTCFVCVKNIFTCASTYMHSDDGRVYLSDLQFLCVSVCVCAQTWSRGAAS